MALGSRTKFDQIKKKIMINHNTHFTVKHLDKC